MQQQYQYEWKADRQGHKNFTECLHRGERRSREKQDCTEQA